MKEDQKGPGSSSSLSWGSLRIILPMTVSFLLGCSIGGISSSLQTRPSEKLMMYATPPTTLHHENAPPPPPPPLGDGCFHIFLDVGANMGVHGRFLLEPEKYPLANVSRGIFDMEFGSQRDNRDFCIFAFEPNPRHEEKLQKNSRAYEAMGWRYHVIHAGVGMEDGILQFYSRKGEHQNDFRAEKIPHATTTVNVTVIHFASWLQDNIYQRKIPTTTYGGNYPSSTTGDIKPKIVMKMDIERLEFQVIPDMLANGALCQIDFAFIEFHGTGPHHSEGRRAWDTVIRNAKICQHFRYRPEDDESYALDGIPFPVPV